MHYKEHGSGVEPESGTLGQHVVSAGGVVGGGQPEYPATFSF
jgi:hypothetical protein